MSFDSNTRLIDLAYNFEKNQKESETILSWEGIISHEIILEFADKIFNTLAAVPETTTIQNLVYHVLVENLQNIAKHESTTESIKGSKNSCLVLITADSKYYTITTGNLIEKKRIHRLSDYLREINSLGRSDLDRLYKQQLKEGRLSEKGGAGLGFIDIKRKTGNPILSKIVDLDETNSFLLLTSCVTRTEN